MWHQKDYGPWFGNKGNLGINYGALMNQSENGFCVAGQTYQVPADFMGNSVLTGEQHNFTCTEIEVFKVKVLRDQPLSPQFAKSVISGQTNSQK